MEIPNRNIIFLQGVFFDQIQTIEDKIRFEELAVNTNDMQSNIGNNYTLSAAIIPPRFKDITLWKELTKNMQLRCWNCNLTFSGTPCFIPKQVRNCIKGKEFDTYGWFCGFACAYSFVNSQAEYRINKNHTDKITMLKMLYTKFYNRKPNEFYEAPSKFMISMYGGHLDLTDYKEQLKIINKRILKESSPTAKDIPR